jgi:hypothetical protein
MDLGTGWQIEEFGRSHTGRAVAVLADGSEPRAMVYDTGSAASHTTSQWWLYDGTLRAPLATHLRGACTCGWRGTSLHPVDWATLGERPYDVAPLGPQEDWFLHVRKIAAQAVPVPDTVTVLLQQLDEQLSLFAEQTPAAALRATAQLERLTDRIGAQAAHRISDSSTPWEAVAVSLGLTELDARALVDAYRYGY